MLIVQPRKGFILQSFWYVYSSELTALRAQIQMPQLDVFHLDLYELTDPKILNTSFTSSSSVASPLIINVELCEPQFPPVSINIGINATNNGTAANAFS